MIVNGGFEACLLALISNPIHFDATTLYNSLNLSGFMRTAFVERIMSRNSIRANAIIEIIITRPHSDVFFVL
jgi:hypothetical protein